MYRVLLVDDEFFPREALKATIPWEDYECTVCGEAKNGQDGIEKARELKPDIILTDINMPIMDGLDMIKEIQKEMPEAVFSIITGYSEFEYARRGIELGVKEFIVKPVDDAELIKTVRHMTEFLDTRRKKEQQFESLKFWAEKNNEENRKNFLEMILTGEREISGQQFRYECGQLGINMETGGYAVSILKIDSRTLVHFTQEKWQKKLSEIISSVEKNLKWNYTVYYKGGGNLYLIFHEIEESAWDKMFLDSLMQKIQLELMQEWVCTVMAGVGNYCRNYKEIAASREAAEASVQEITVSKLVADMQQFIHENYADPDLSLKEIAENLFVNYSYLSTQFKKEIGMSASQYISRFRMMKAADALRNGEENMVEIAVAVGYTDTKYFYRCFKKEFGMTPYQCMEEMRKARQSGEVF